MSEGPRKKSPRAPSMPLEEAVGRALEVYEKEQRHPAPTDVVARDIGYKSANSGSALAAIASLRGYGLLERPESGKLAVSADVQSFQYTPDGALKNELLRKWLTSPPVFADLLRKYQGGLPSDATVRFDLIQKGFKPGTAESILKVFKQSVEYADYYGHQDANEQESSLPFSESAIENQVAPPVKAIPASNGLASLSESFDRIPVRLDAKRRAWLEIPTPFYEADKSRLKAQIDLLLTDDEVDNSTVD